MKRILFLLLVVSLMVIPSTLFSETLDKGILNISKHMLNDYKLKPPHNNITILKFYPVDKNPSLRIGEYLQRKIKVKMFELDKGKTLNFVTDGKLTNLVVAHGLKGLQKIYDEVTRIELGKMHSADHFIYGTYETKPGNSVEIVCYLVDIKKGINRSMVVEQIKNVPEYYIGGNASSPGSVRKYKVLNKNPKDIYMVGPHIENINKNPR